jgi:hypothetical protein
MKYFNSLPSVANIDANGNYYLLKNILIRTKLTFELSRNPMLFYKYSIQEQDTPESIAYKYYGDQYRYWIVLLANEIMNPLWEWPLTNQQFIKYLENKYASAIGGEDTALTYTTGTLHHYEKIITTIDDDSQTSAVKTVDIDADTFNSLSEQTDVNTFLNGSKVTRITSKRAVSIYDYENELNESKREINILNSAYVSDIESQYEKLVRI